MKSIYKSILLLLGLFMFNVVAKGQDCSSVLVEAYGMNPQTGAHNFFGVRVTLLVTHHSDITVTGYIHRDVDEEGNQDHPFSLTVSAGNTVAETLPGFYQTDPASGASVTIASISFCPANEIYANYAGVSIVYEVDNNILRFSTAADLNTVINQLDEDYENYNTEYENQFDPNLSEEELDEIDEQQNFDEFHTFRVFENLFPGFTTKRRELEVMEEAWLNTNFESGDPDDHDLTMDDAENAVFSNNYAVKVSSDVYELTNDGLYINGQLQASVNGNYNNGIMAVTTLENNPLDVSGVLGYSEVNNSGPSVGSDDYFSWNPQNLGGGCKSNKKDKDFHVHGDTRFKIKVALNSTWIRSSAKGKVVHFKKKNNGWKRKRAKMAVHVGGTVYNNECSDSRTFSYRDPTSGLKKRKQLKVKYWQPGIIWRTEPEKLGASYESPGYAGGVRLIF
jgi:hypothetical protein